MSELVKKIGVGYIDDNMLTISEKVKANTEIKSKVKESTFKYLTEKQKEHIKDLETQEYLKSALVTNKEAEIITALTSQTVRGIKKNTLQG